jgi:hypothetical protein
MNGDTGDANQSGRSGDLRLYVVDDDAQTLVALLAPLVAGAARHTTVGPITRITPVSGRRPDHPGGGLLTRTPHSGAAVLGNLGGLLGVATGAGLVYATNPWVGLPTGAAVSVLAVWQAVRRQRRVNRAWAGGHRVLTHPEDKDTFRTALSGAVRTIRSWPALQATIRLGDPGPALARSLWELAGVLAQRAPVRDVHRKLAPVAGEVLVDSAVRADVAVRLSQAEQTLRRLGTEVDQRVRALTTLADETDRFIRQQQALAQARTVVSDADRVLGALATANQPTDDTGAELTERTTAVLTAYRELTNPMNVPES